MVFPVGDKFTMSKPLTEMTSWRKAHHLSRADVAKRFNVSPVTIWRWETGERRVSLDFAVKVSKTIGAPLERVLGL